MQALAERLDAALGGRPFTGYDPVGFTALKTVAPAPEVLVGKKLERVGRRGKYLVLELDGGFRLLVHLSQAGRVDIEDPPKRTRGKGVVRLVFGPSAAGGTARALYVREHGTERKAAWWVLAPGDPGPLARLGPEPDDAAFAALVHAGVDQRRVHTLLRDQKTVAGIGRGYVDDILWRAEMSPYVTLGKLDADQRAGLVDAVRAVLADGLAAERRRTGGLGEAKLGEAFAVHGRHGAPCPRCGTNLRRVSYESYEVTYCPACQTEGKVLADRRMSRLLK